MRSTRSHPQRTGWRPSVTVEEVLRRTVEWYLDNEDWWRPLPTRAGVGERLARHEGPSGLWPEPAGRDRAWPPCARCALSGRDVADLTDAAACAALIAIRAVRR